MMKQIVGKAARKVAPRTVDNLLFLSRTRAKGDDVIDLLHIYEEELRDLKAEMNEMRRDQRRMAELYDLVFERLRAQVDTEAKS